MKGRETSVSDSSACVSDSENEDDFYRDQDELANSELLYDLPDDEDFNSPVPTFSHIEYDTVEKADAEPFHLLEEEDYSTETLWTKFTVENMIA